VSPAHPQALATALGSLSSVALSSERVIRVYHGPTFSVQCGDWPPCEEQISPSQRATTLTEPDEELPTLKKSCRISSAPTNERAVDGSFFQSTKGSIFVSAHARGKRLVAVVGSKKALAIAVKNDKTQKRFTWLGNRLRSA